MEEDATPEMIAAATESMALIAREIDNAVAICLEAGFEPPEGIDQVPADPIERLKWNYRYAQAAIDWIESDPDWLSIGFGPRAAAELIDAGVRIQIAAHGIGDLPLAGAIALHGYSVVYGTWRAELNRWKRTRDGADEQQTFTEIASDVAAMQQAGEAATGDPRQAIAELGQSGGWASGNARRWWWPIAWERWKERRRIEPDELVKEVAARLMEEMERSFPARKGPKKGQKLPKDIGGYIKVVGKFKRGWTPPDKT